MLKQEEIFEACKNTINKFKNVDNEDYPFALIKYLNKNFKEDSIFKSKNATFKIFIPEWLKI